jgi:hypothetical protein
MPSFSSFSANKSRRPGMQWSDDDCDVREGALDGPVIGRIYSVAPTGNWLFWAVQLFPAVAADSGTAETREAAMAEFKVQWIQRRVGASVDQAALARRTKKRPRVRRRPRSTCNTS